MLARRFLALLGVMSLLALIGCASDGVETSVVHDPLVAFPSQATFSWDAAANKLPADERIAALDLDPLIRAAASQELALRGYRAAASGAPDYRLSYQLAVNTWIGADNSTSVASLSLLLVDAKLDRRVWLGYELDRRVWLGYGRAEIHVGISREERTKRLRAAFATMLEKFPPNQGRT